MTARISARIALLTLALGAATPALAHPGHGTGFVAGLVHPLTGIDHLLAMLMVGLWAGLAFPTAKWVCPAAFVGFMLAGFGWGAAGGGFPFAETLILASLVGLGGALLFDLRPPLALGTAMVALFAVAHGFAHGAEMPEGARPLGFVAGFALTTIALHAAGIAIAWRAQRMDSRLLGRVIGGVATVTAAALALQA
jgi:urease accessory protein